MVGPATSMVTGVKHPSGYFACRRCKVKGKQVTHTYTNKKGKEVTRKMRSVRYPTLHQLEKRKHRDFVIFAQTIEEPHLQNVKFMKEGINTNEYQDAGSELSGNVDREGENENEEFAFLFNDEEENINR